MAISTVKVGATMKDKFRTEIHCSNPFVVDQPIAAGGNNEGPNPLEVFLSSLAACICALARIISNQRRLKVRGVQVDVEGDIDKDYLMGLTSEGRAGFTEIRSYVKIDADMTEEEKKEYLHEIERRCPIADNMANTTKLFAEVVKL